MKLVLFDIDGTLMAARGAGVQAMERAGREVFGAAFSLDGVDCAGNLDPLIVREAARRSGVEVENARFARFRARYASLLVDALATCAGVGAYPGAIDLVGRVRALEGAVVGLLTGNFGHTAALKLEHVGFDVGWFVVGAFGDMAPSRAELVPVAIEQCRTTRGEPTRIVIVGDTPRDVACAHANGCPVLAVATGRFSREQLERARADRVVDDLRDPEPLLELLAEPVG